MTTITTRSGKGSPLTNDEVDANFTGLNSDKVEASGDSMTGNLSFGDNNKAIFGAGSDLQIYHDGSASRIVDAGTGGLTLQADANVVVQNSAGTETKAEFTTDGAVNLYHDNNLKLATTSAGINVTGIIKASGNGKLQISDDTEGSTFEFNVGGGGALEIYDGTTERMQIDSSGVVQILNATPTLKFTDTDNNYDATIQGLSGSLVLTADSGAEFGTESIQFKTGAAERMRLGTSEAVVNESSNDYDFRVESNDSTHMLFVEAGTNRVGINNSDPSSTLHVTGTYGDTGFIRMSGGAQEHYWYLEDAVNSVFNIGTGSAGAAFDFRTNNVSKLKIGAGEVVANEGSADQDFRVESNNNANMLYVDGANDRVAIGTNTQSAVLTIESAGNGYATGSIALKASGSSDTGFITNAGGNIYFSHDGTNDDVVLKSGETIFNETSLDKDFRVESDGNTHMLFVDAGQNAVGINDSSPSGVRLTVLGVDSAAVGWGDTSKRGFLSFDGSGNPIVRAGSGLGLKIQSNSTRDVATFGASETVFNEPGNNQDFRVEGDNDPNLLFIDASADTVNIGNTTDFGGILNVNGGLNSKQAVFTSTNNRGLALSTASRSGQNDGVAIIDAQDTESTGGRFEIHTMGAERARFERDQIVFNELSNDQDFRVESDNNSNAVFVNAGTDSVHFGTSGNFGGSRMNVEHPTDCFGLNLGPNASGQRFLLYFNYNGTPIGSVKGESTGVTYNTTSDRRLKKDIETITDGTDKLMAMNPVTHGWKADPEADAVHGFIAQEMMDIVPEAVSGDPDGEEMMSMDYGRITPVLVAALQDAHKKIAELETRLNELEGK